MTGLLVIMGSGETAPTMVKPHREIFQRCGDRPAVLLDTPYGFQENADDISAKAVKYFADSTGRQLGVVNWRTAPEPGLPRERALAALRDAGWLFAGPGSPTYALRQWTDTELPSVLQEALNSGHVVCFASAAALTLGSHTIPVYEIYKAGTEPHWVPGLDLFHQVTGLPAVLIPHYDNTEGGHHDTRFCYLGERRLRYLESLLPSEAFIIGVDEHTAVTMDLDAKTATVSGNGTMTIRRRGHSTVFPNGTVLTFDELGSEHPGTASAHVSSGSAELTEAGAVADDPTPVILAAETDRLNAAFAAAAEAGDADSCVTALLDLDQLLTEWSSDLSDDVGYARTVFRQMIVRLGDLAGTVDPKSTALPAVLDLVVDIRGTARAGRDFATADAIRDKLAAAGVEIRDTPDGATWHLNES